MSTLLKVTLSLIVSTFVSRLASIQPAIAQIRQPVPSTQSRNDEQLSELLRRGREYVDAGDYANAIAIYRQAASLDEQNPKIFSGIGYLYARQGNFLEAVRAYQQALSLDPNNADFYYALGY
ncbi:MAG: tetratricopeptide repeat protein, partial [Brasilonema sp.]